MYNKLKCKNPAKYGMSKIVVEDVSKEEILTEQTFNSIDVLGWYGEWRNISRLPEWNGFIVQLAKNNDNFIRLGGFNMLMSLLGGIGLITIGSGVKEAPSTIYTPNFVEKNLEGHAYSRSVRGNTLLHLTLSNITFHDMQIEDNALDDFK